MKAPPWKPVEFAKICFRPRNHPNKLQQAHGQTLRKTCSAAEKFDGKTWWCWPPPAPPRSATTPTQAAAAVLAWLGLAGCLVALQFSQCRNVHEFTLLLMLLLPDWQGSKTTTTEKKNLVQTTTIYYAH